jgi:FMN phosphatase YigB (HAD superfamily)
MTTPNVPTLLIFDAGGVLYTLDYERKWRQFEKASGLSYEAIKTVLYDEDFILFERGLIGAEHYYATVVRRLGANLSFDAFSRVFNSFLIKRDRMFSLLARLSSKVRLHILSNTNAINAVCIRHDLDGIPAGMTLSCETGLRKPEPQIYRAALDRAGVASFNARFIDDFEENVTAAEAVGIRSHRFVGEKGLLRFLATEGIEATQA